MSCGVPAGAISPDQIVASNSGRPCSASGCSFGAMRNALALGNADRNELALLGLR